MRVSSYRTVLRKEPEGGYTVMVPSLPGCVTYGETVDHAITMAKEAIELYVESLQAHDEAMPSDKSIRSEHDAEWQRWRGELAGSNVLAEHLTGHAAEMSKDAVSGGMAMIITQIY